MPPPKLKNDCFALPPGVDWTPVDKALGMLRSRLATVVGAETIGVADALGRVVASDVKARRSNPPTANAAVDGYGFAHQSMGEGAQELPLVQGRSAAGGAYEGEVPAGTAIRILTGAQLPEGVDTVIMQEDIELKDAAISFNSGLKMGANTRLAGEDVIKDAAVFSSGRRLHPHDLALLAAVGVAEIDVYKPLRVGVLSTGDEIRPLGEEISDQQIYDANRPMLLTMLKRWGLQAVDLGHVQDDRDALRARLEQSVEQVDAVLTSGGASEGDEDHLSALLSDEGSMHTWRIAVKPGRPLALGQWKDVPVFGLPGNPVAAYVCSLIFTRPALGILGGENWQEPQGYRVPAAFSKSKKDGRREYLRARLNAEGRAEVFRSEGSGRISGLSWAGGLVELEDAGGQVNPGDPVLFYPYSTFGL